MQPTVVLALQKMVVEGGQLGAPLWSRGQLAA